MLRETGQPMAVPVFAQGGAAAAQGRMFLLPQAGIGRSCIESVCKNMRNDLCRPAACRTAYKNMR